ncbi:hypothetical protein [Thalassomonas viridans]|nr:hypothetical protein [Thalassomonas viridans]
MMIKNILFLIACAAIVAVAWGFYAFFGEYVVSIFLTIILISVMVKPVKSKFGNKAKPDKSINSDN